MSNSAAFLQENNVTLQENNVTLQENNVFVRPDGGFVLADNVFEINPSYRFQWETSQQSYVLLYPEGMISLNDTAAEILKRVNGASTVRDITSSLEKDFEVDSLQNDVFNFLGDAYERRWIQTTFCEK